MKKPDNLRNYFLMQRPGERFKDLCVVDKRTVWGAKINSDGVVVPVVMQTTNNNGSFKAYFADLSKGYFYPHCPDKIFKVLTDPASWPESYEYKEFAEDWYNTELEEKKAFAKYSAARSFLFKDGLQTSNGMVQFAMYSDAYGGIWLPKTDFLLDDLDKSMVFDITPEFALTNEAIILDGFDRNQWEKVHGGTVVIDHTGSSPEIYGNVHGDVNGLAITFMEEGISVDGEKLVCDVQDEPVSIQCSDMKACWKSGMRGKLVSEDLVRVLEIVKDADGETVKRVRYPLNEEGDCPWALAYQDILE